MAHSKAILWSVIAAFVGGCEAPLIEPLERCRFSSECELGVECSERGLCEASAAAAPGIRANGTLAPDLVVSEIQDVTLTCGLRISPQSGGLGEQPVPENCVQRAGVMITNRGAVASDTPFTLQTSFDPAQSLLVTQEVSVQLGPQRSLLLQVETPPGLDCSPNCRVCATVDATERVSEADETNNQGCTLQWTSFQPDAPPASPDTSRLGIDDFQDSDSSPTPGDLSPWSCFTEGAEGQTVQCGVTQEVSGNVAYTVQFELQDPLDGVPNPLLVGARTTLTARTLDLSNYGDIVLSARLEATRLVAPEGVLSVRFGCGRNMEARARLSRTWSPLVLALTSFTSVQDDEYNDACRASIDSMSIGFEPTLADGETASGRLWIDGIYAE